MDKLDVKRLIERKVDEEGSIRRLAKKWGFDAANFHRMLMGKIPYSKKLLKKLGLEKQVFYVKRNEKKKTKKV